MTLDRNEGRKKELKKRLKGTVDRYESVFSKPLTVEELKFYLGEERKSVRLGFLRDRMGVLSETDLDYLDKLVKDFGKANDLPPELEDEIEDHSDEDIDFDEAE